MIARTRRDVKNVSVLKIS